MARKKSTDEVVKAAGGAVAVAKAFRISPEAVYLWNEVPVLRVLVLERLSGIPRHEIRPDIYPPPGGGR